MKINDVPIFQIYDGMLQNYCCSTLGNAITIEGMYHVAYKYEDANNGGRYVLILNKRNSNRKSSIFYFCPYCGKKIDENY